MAPRTLREQTDYTIQNNNMAQGLTLEQLNNIGAKPATNTPPPSPTGGLTLQQVMAQQSTSPQAAPQDLLQKAGNAVNSIFPGKQVGQAIGTAVGAGITKAGDLLHGTNNYKNYDLSAPTPVQVGGDIAQGALSVAAPGVGDGLGTAATIGANAALGASIGATGAVAQGQSVGQVAKQGAIGGLAGGALSAVGEGTKALSDHLPSWFAKAALPKMKDAAAFKYLPNEAGGYTRTAQETAAQYALDNTKGLSVTKMLEHSNQSTTGYNKQIQTILAHPEYKGNIGNGAQAIQDTLKQFENAQLTQGKVLSIAKSVAPSQAAIVDKVANGTATLAEKNALRVALDDGTKKIFIDHPNVSFQKQVGAAFANSLRGEVQTVAPETAPIFNKYSKELTLNSALQKANNKKQGVLGDLIAGGTGFASGGLKGAAEAIAVERGLRSPTGQLLAGKAVQGLAKSAPAISAVGKAVKAPLLKKITE